MSKSQIAKQDAREMAISGNLPTSQQAAYNKLQKGKVLEVSTTGIELRALKALVEKGLAKKNFQSHMYYELAS